MVFKYFTKLSTLLKRYMNMNSVRIRQSAMHVSECLIHYFLKCAFNKQKYKKLQ